jgi:hypothetical protein
MSIWVSGWTAGTSRTRRGSPGRAPVRKSDIRCLQVRLAGLEPATDGLEVRRRRASRLNRPTPYGTTRVHISPGQSPLSQPKPEHVGSARRGAVGGVPEGFCSTSRVACIPWVANKMLAQQ